MKVQIKQIFLMLLILGIALPACKKKTTTPTPTPDTCADITDTRDGKTYKTVKIGDQCWMAENLNWEAPSGSSCYANDPANCDDLGRVYTYDGVKDACPDGWHLPLSSEYQTLISELGGEAVAGKKLKVGGSSGFEALLAGGIGLSGNSVGLNSSVFLWTSTDFSTVNTKYVLWLTTADDVTITATSDLEGNYCRCIKD